MIAALALGFMLGACSGASPEALAQNDPWERTNRDIFDFNVQVDQLVARPIAKGYKAGEVDEWLSFVNKRIQYWKGEEKARKIPLVFKY